MDKQQSTEDTLVTVRRQWNDSGHTARVRLTDLRHFHFRTTGGGYGASGGFGNTAPKPFLHARMWCDRVVDGEVGHSCIHGPAPHEILVCITQTDNGKPLFRRLAALAEVR
jgi:hypothetical protein